MTMHYTVKQLTNMTGEELIRLMDQQSEVVDNMNLLSDSQRTSDNDHSKRVARLNIEGISDEWARRFEG